MSTSTGTPLQALLDFRLATGANHMRSPRVVNLAGLNKYLWHKIFYNTPAKKAVQGGSEIDFPFMLDDGGTFQTLQPGQFRQYKRIDNVRKARAAWRQWWDHKLWLRHELMLNQRFKYGNRAEKFDVLFDLDTQKEQRMQTSIANGLETQLGAVPDGVQSDPDQVGGNQVMSLFAHINQDAYGLFGRYINTSGAVASNAGVTNPFTTKQAVDPTIGGGTIVAAGASALGRVDKGKLAPNVIQYSSKAPNVDTNIFAALRAAFRACSWEGPETTRQWFENTNFNNMRALASDYALRVVENLILAGQDRFVIGPQDLGVPMPQVYGVPLMWWPRLDTAPIYDTNHNSSGVPTTKTTELAVAPGASGVGWGKGGRIYMINFNSIYPVCHDEMWMYREAMSPHFNVPDVFPEYVEGWHNWVCEDYRQHAVIAPVGDMTV